MEKLSNIANVLLYKNEENINGLCLLITFPKWFHGLRLSDRGPMIVGCIVYLFQLIKLVEIFFKKTQEKKNGSTMRSKELGDELVCFI